MSARLHSRRSPWQGGCCRKNRPSSSLQVRACGRQPGGHGHGNVQANEREHNPESGAQGRCVLIDPRVYAGQSQRGWDITEEMVGGPEWAAKDMEDMYGVDTGLNGAHYPSSCYQQHTCSVAHKGGIVEMKANGYITIIGHRCQ